MSYREIDFQNDIVTLTKIHNAYPSVTAELTAIATALGSDATTHDWTIETPAPALLKGIGQTRFTNDVLLIVNAGKGGNLPAATMAAAIDAVISVASKPGVVDIPYLSANASPPITGTTLSCTQGNWVGTPVSYLYQFKRDGTNVGSNSATPTYALVSGDTGRHSMTCVVTATNVQGSTIAPPSNAIFVP